MQALNVRLLQENNDLRHHLNQAQYLDILIERVLFDKCEAEFEAEQHMRHAAKKENQRYREEQECKNNIKCKNNIRGAMVSDDEAE